MSDVQLEHVNITVSDAKRTAKYICDIFGWNVRWHGAAIDDGYTYHVGDDERYLAIYSPTKTDSASPKGYAMIGRLNHVGVVVDDLDLIEKRVAAAGFKPFNHRDYEPGRRFYFLDDDKIEFEVVSYK